jgi:RNA polymerase sigma-70 factor (ECF subfamily)
MIAIAAADLGFAIAAPEGEALRSASSEAELAQAAAGGNRDAFARLVESHKGAVYGLCVRLLRHPEEARDAAQETFVRAYASLEVYDPAQPFIAWLLRIARNHCIDLHRRRAPRGTEIRIDHPEQGGESAQPRNLPDLEAVPADEQVARAQASRWLEGAVAALPESYREVITLFHVEHLSYKEIAAVMEVPIGTVMTWLHRARAQLRTQLEGGRE